MGADWLQGPYVYSLYREQYEFPERLVALLFVTGFVSAGMAAPLVGVWADQHGRRKLCLAFCITYTLACILILIPSLPILLAGRLLGGVSTSILFSAFESWLISSVSSMGLPSADLSTIMGRATLVNGFVAAAAGVFSNQLVQSTQNFASPFIASGCLLVSAFFVISASWSENYGSGGGSATTDIWQVKRMGHAWRIVRDDPMLFILGLTQTCFEGSMYLFVFIWVPSLQEATLYKDALPLGYIFSSLMVSMMSGSILYTMIVALSKIKGSDSSLTTHAKLSSLVCAVSALALACSISSKNEQVRFFAFCVFEACVGMYYPVQGMLRGTLISNEHRATLSSLFRVPLNVFVVFSLLTGVSSARQAVLTGSAIMLAFSSLMTGAVIVDQSDAVTHSAAIGSAHRS
ncbi:Major facilitator superfamily domain-containing protein 5 [Leucoagaricus sp. SymC.cos]|nr:Major facilitator superfamily domain-containing protein 5 [Leucoagaricus sp. SymC.cos]